MQYLVAGIKWRALAKETEREFEKEIHPADPTDKQLAARAAYNEREFDSPENFHRLPMTLFYGKAILIVVAYIYLVADLGYRFAFG